MPIAKAVVVGLGQVNPKVYKTDGACPQCEVNAQKMYDLLQSIGFDCGQRALLSRWAMKADILNALAAATQLSAGDIFVFYFAGHGMGDSGTHTLAAYDGKIYTSSDIHGPIWLRCRADVRIVMICDCCNSGTNYLLLRLSRWVLNLSRFLNERSSAAHRRRAKKGVVRIPLWATVPAPVQAAANGQMQAQMIHFAAAQDETDAVDGAFTQALLDVWNHGSFTGYRGFFCQIAQKVIAAQLQVPEYRLYGPVTDAFEGQQPFTIDLPGNGQPVVTRVVTPADCLAALPRGSTAPRTRRRWRP